VAGRRGEYRTWEELGVSERRRGLAILGGVGAVAVGAVVWVLGPTDGTAPSGAPGPVLTVVSPSAVVAAASPDSGLDTWFASIAGARTDLTSTEATVRKAIAELNGMALQPACVLLDSHAIDAQRLGGVPDGDVGRAWTKGLADYQEAARSCAQLFDGTQVAPETLRANTSAALDAADGAWASLVSVTPSPVLAEATASPDGGTEHSVVAAASGTPAG
jgi:hypothetical protein